MTYDELDKKIIDIKKKGLNIILEASMIAEIRESFYNVRIDEKMQEISNTFVKNVRYLETLHGQFPTYGKIREFMGVIAHPDHNDYIFGKKRVGSLRTFFLVGEFYGLPVELLLFNDLETHGDILKKTYPALFKQSRN